MAQTQLAVQLYTLRDFCKTERDLAETCRKLKAQGWGAVQVSAVGVDDPGTIKRILDDHGLACCATHPSPGDLIWNDPAKLVDDLNTLDCRYTAIGGYFPKPEEFTAENWKAWIKRFNAAAEKYADTGKRIGYHNHSHEFAKLGGKEDIGGITAMELLADTLREDVWFELDTYWVAHGGGSPAAWLRRLDGRVPVIHIKDYAIDAHRQPYMAEIGVGNLNWTGILAAARNAGVESYCVEQDTCYRDPFDSLQTSLENCHKMGLS